VRPLSPRERRLVALGGLAAALAVLWLALIGPLIGGFADRAAERAQLAATYQRNQRLMTALPVWRRLALTQARTAGRFAIGAPSESLAVESFKERLQKLAADEGFAISSVQDLQADAPTGDVRIRADMQLTLTQLCDTLRRLETEGAYVVVDYLSISADRAFATGRAAPIDVRLELTSAYHPSGARPS
jgi:general secretion pathway protein M